MMERKVEVYVLDKYYTPNWEALVKVIAQKAPNLKGFTREQSVKIAEVEIGDLFNWNKKERLEELSKLYGFNLIELCKEIQRQCELDERISRKKLEIMNYDLELEAYGNQPWNHTASITRQLKYKAMLELEILQDEFYTNKYHGF